MWCSLMPRLIVFLGFLFMQEYGLSTRLDVVDITWHVAVALHEQIH